MTPTPLDAKPQGAQLKRYAQWTDGSIRSADDGDLCHYDEAAERIEKLERENETLNIRLNAREEVLDHIRSQLIALGSRADARRITTAISDIAQERDTALRALAEASRERDELVAALENNRKMLHDEIENHSNTRMECDQRFHKVFMETVELIRNDVITDWDRDYKSVADELFELIETYSKRAILAKPDKEA